MSDNEQKIKAWLAGQRQAMIDLLREVVDIDSGSYDKQGVDAVGARFRRHARGPHRVGMRPAARVADRGDVVDVDAEAQMAIRHVCSLMVSPAPARPS